MNDKEIKDIISYSEGIKAKLILSKAIYERDTIFRTARRFNNKCVILVEPFEQSNVAIYLQIKNDTKNDIKIIAEEFCNELINQQVLIECERKYQKIREIIFNHAFSPIADLEKELTK